MDLQEFREIVTVHTVRKDLKLEAGERNQYELIMDIPSIDETSFMPKYLSPDEEMLLQSWSPTYHGASFKIRYYVYTRALFTNMPANKCQRVLNEVRIYKRPEFIYSEQPSGYGPKDPFTYHNGGKKAMLGS